MYYPIVSTYARHLNYSFEIKYLYALSSPKYNSRLYKVEFWMVIYFLFVPICFNLLQFLQDWLLARALIFFV